MDRHATGAERMRVAGELTQHPVAFVSPPCAYRGDQKDRLFLSGICYHFGSFPATQGIGDVNWPWAVSLHFCWTFLGMGLWGCIHKYRIQTSGRIKD